MEMRWVVVELNCIGSRYKNTSGGQHNFFNKIGAFGCEISYNENEVLNCNFVRKRQSCSLPRFIKPFQG